MLAFDQKLRWRARAKIDDWEKGEKFLLVINNKPKNTLTLRTFLED